MFICCLLGSCPEPYSWWECALHSTHSLFPLIARNFESYKQFLDMDRGKSAF